ncbi:MAG: helical backbone metal receptor [Campylobacterota bacterium]|nr:helical backbone metal receptor [Campylobacterota bacterium]
MRLIVLLLITFNLYAERIVALSPSITDILFALGRGNEVVGVSNYTFYPQKATTLPTVGGYFHPNIEKILSLQPSLIIAQPHHGEFLSQLSALGIKTKVIVLESIDDIKKSIAELADSHTAKAKQLIADIDNAIHRAKYTQTNSTVIIVFGLFEDLSDNIYISGQKLFFNEIIELCGAKNAFTSAVPQQPVLNYEDLIALNPHRVIILNGNNNPNAKKAIQNWQKTPIKAAKDGAIRVLNHDFISLPSQRINLSIDVICKAIND